VNKANKLRSDIGVIGNRPNNLSAGPTGAPTGQQTNSTRSRLYRAILCI